MNTEYGEGQASAEVDVCVCVSVSVSVSVSVCVCLGRFWQNVFFPNCQVRVVRFYVRCAAPPLAPPSPSPFAGPHLAALDCSDSRRTSSASSWLQWSSPDLICQLLIAVVVAGLHLPALDRSGPRRTSTCESLSAVGLAGLQPVRFGAPWASPDSNRTSTARNKAI